MARIARFYKHESCGQCTPCREGSGWMWRILDRVVKRKATYGDVELLSDVTKQIEGHTICAFGEGSAWPVQGMTRMGMKESEMGEIAQLMGAVMKRKDVLQQVGRLREQFTEVQFC